MLIHLQNNGEKLKVSGSRRRHHAADEDLQQPPTLGVPGRLRSKHLKLKQTCWNADGAEDFLSLSADSCYLGEREADSLTTVVHGTSYSNRPRP
ncbi:hypothetical protein EVAR_78575_1 [Eumeta japonica]|uniref:Uncharacterized protein n=1 Tax=Eumeta variegata TaxID=151549 RepID=A0A4C1W8P4_EUMVA|nr:hypothetical protein EVAR_78575_1 [Eumeta japonica]